MTQPTVQVRRARERFTTVAAGVESRHTFSFGAHYDPDNVGHGRLMVSNDELVQARAGFDDHPHRDAEIVTWVLSGSLRHQDSRGHQGVVYPGLAQRMSAGSGIVHAERNDAYRIDVDRPVAPVRFVQMWVRPDEAGSAPSYRQHEVELTELPKGWLPVVSGSVPDAAVSLGARGATLWVTVLGPGVDRVLPENRFVHVYVARGEVDLESVGGLGEGDSVRVSGPAALRVTGRVEAELLVWELDA